MSKKSNANANAVKVPITGDNLNVSKLNQEFRKKGIGFLEKCSKNLLKEWLKVLNDSYYNDESNVSTDYLLTDNEYDVIKGYFDLFHFSQEDVAVVGAPIKFEEGLERKKVVLPYFMPSMNKIKPDTGLLEEWKKKFVGPYILSHKLDGVSCLLVVKPGGKDRFLYTRGDGRVGQDISHLIPYLSLPIPGLDFGAGFRDGVVIRGELIVPKKVFAEKFAGSFANPRNFVSGLVNQKAGTIDPSVIIGNVHLVSYELLFPENVKPSMQMQILQNFSVFGLEKVVSLVVRGDLLTNSYLSDVLVLARESSIYEIDGIICSSDAVYERKEKNPDHAFAFKMVLTDQVAEAKVVDVLWSPSKDGYLKPRVRIEPITLGGVSIEYATGFNAKFIRDYGIGVGAVVELIRSGDVIPHIRRVISVGGSGAKMPEGLYVWNETGVDVLLSGSDLDSDLTVREKLVAGFFQGIDVVGLSSGLVARLISAGFDTVAKIVAMKMEDFMGIEGFQKKLATKIYEGIRKGLQKVGLIELMAASHLFGRGFGERKLRMVLEEYPDVLVSSESKDEKWRRVLAIKGMAGKTAHVFVEGLDPFLKFLEEIGCADKLSKESGKDSLEPSKMEVMDQINTNGNDELKGKTIVMTGFRDAGLEEELKKRGAKLGSSVSKNTFLVLVKENKKGEEKEIVLTGKLKQAKELGVLIMGVEEFLFHFHFHFLEKSGAKTNF